MCIWDDLEKMASEVDSQGKAIHEEAISQLEERIDAASVGLKRDDDKAYDGGIFLGQKVTVTREVTVEESLSGLPEPLIGLSKAVIYRGPIVAKVGTTGRVVKIADDEGSKAFFVELDTERTLPATPFPADALDASDLSFAGSTDGYPEGFKVGAKVKANRRITYKDAYSGHVTPDLYEDGLREIERVQKEHGADIWTVLAEGQEATITDLPRAMGNRSGIEDMIVVATNEHPNGTPIPAAWVDLAQVEEVA